jgi:hypothetical protein
VIADLDAIVKLFAIDLNKILRFESARHLIEGRQAIEPHFCLHEGREDGGDAIDALLYGVW